MKKHNKVLLGIIVVMTVLFLVSMTACSTVEQKQLTTPSNLTVEDGILYWNTVSGANGYVINVNNVDKASVSTFSYDLSALKLVEGETYLFRVKATNNLGLFIDSEYSTPYEYVHAVEDEDDNQNENVTTLTTPTKLSIDNGVLTWYPVSNAINYTVAVNRIEYLAEENEFDLSAFDDGEYTIKVKANGDGEGIVDSQYSTEFVANLYDGSLSESTYFSEFVNLNTEESFLGYGFNVIEDSVISDRDVLTSFRIFNKDDILNTRLLKVYSSTHNMEEISEETMEAFTEKYNRALNVDVSGSLMRAADFTFGKLSAGAASSLGFSFGLKQNYTTNVSSAKSRHYYSIMITDQKFYIVMQATMDDYRDMLDESFKKDLYDPNVDPMTLFSRYGTHFITSASMGGRVNAYYNLSSTVLEQSSSVEKYYSIGTAIKNAFSAAFSKRKNEMEGGTSGELDANVSWENKLSNTFSQNNVISTSSISCYGGISTNMNSIDGIAANYEEWSKSLDTYPSLIGIKDSNSLIPIWELIEAQDDDASVYSYIDPHTGETKQGTRRQQLQAFFTSYGINNYDILMAASGLPETIDPDSIGDFTINGKGPQGDYYWVDADSINTLQFIVNPTNATGTKYYSISSGTQDYASINENNQLVVKSTAELDALGVGDEDVIIKLNYGIGTISSSVNIKVRRTYKVEFNLGNYDALEGYYIRDYGAILYGSPIAEPTFMYVDKGGLAPEAVPITMEGYIFNGWSVLTNGSYSTYNFNEPVTKNLKLYANWTRKSHSVTFDADNGTEIQKKSYYWGDKITEPTDPSKEHYSFTGWYVDGADMPFDFDGSVVKADFTLTARYTPVEYTVTLNANGGTLTTTSFTTDINKHFVISGVEIPSKTDYTFSHWINVTNDGEVISSTAIHTYQFVKNTNLTAIYTPTEKRVIFYNYDDSTGTTQKVKYLEVTTNIEKGHVLSSEDIPENPSRTGYTFNGWTLTAGGENINVVTYEFKSPVTEVYPNYTINKFNVTFYNGSAIHHMLEEVSYNSKITAPTEEPKLTDYEFVGWYKDSAFTVAFDFTNDTITTDTCLYAQFTEDLSIWRTISLVTNWEGVELEDLRLKNTDTLGNNYTPDTFTRRIGYTFGGWYIDDSTFSNRVNSDSVINTFVPEDAMSITLYAKWTKNTYPLTFKHADGTDYVATQPIEYGAPIVKPTDPIIEGYNFLYWYETAGEEFDFNNATMPAREIILYAKVEILSFTLYFHREEGGEFKIGDGEYSPYYSAEYEYGTSISKCPVASYPTRTGETCVGWDTAFPLTMPASDVHVYAQWSKNKHTITYYTNSTTDTVDANSPIFERKEGVEYNTLLSELTTTNTPADDAEFKEGHTFGGWQYYVSTIDEQGTAIYEEAYTLPDEDVIALAIWNKEIYTITAKVQGNEDQIINVLYGESIKEALKSVELVSNGYVFDGTWTYDNTTISENYDTLMPAKNITCIANYSVNKSTYNLSDQIMKGDLLGNSVNVISADVDITNFVGFNKSVLSDKVFKVTVSANYTFGNYYINVNIKSGDSVFFNEDVSVASKTFSYTCIAEEFISGFDFTFTAGHAHTSDYTITNIVITVEVIEEPTYKLSLALEDTKKNYNSTGKDTVHAYVGGSKSISYYYTEGQTLTLPVPTKTGHVFEGYTFNPSSITYNTVTGKTSALPAIDEGVTATPIMTPKTISGNNKIEREITDTGKWCMEQGSMDTINISALSVFFNSNYKIHFTLTLTLKEVDDGYQEMALFNTNATISNSETQHSTDIKEEVIEKGVGLLDWVQFQHGEQKIDTSIWAHPAVTFEISGEHCRNYMYVRYDANGKGDDDWVKTNLKYEITVTEKSN